MPKLSVLDMVKDILSEMDSDDVNSIDDAEEGYQVARIIKNTYFEIITAKHYKHFDRIHSLTSSGTNTKPTHMSFPSDVVFNHWIKYNDELITYKEPQDFLEVISNLSSNYDTVVDDSGVSLKIGNNKKPTYWTSFDEENIICDSYDSALDTTLQQSKVKAFSQIEPSFTISDNFTPDLPILMFPQLLEEAKSTCFAHIKQMPSSKAEQKANRQRSRVSQKGRVSNGIKFPNYGR